MPHYPTPEALAAALAAKPEEVPHELHGPGTHPDTGEITHLGPHSTQVVYGPVAPERIAHGESFRPPKGGAAAVILRRAGSM